MSLDGEDLERLRALARARSDLQSLADHPVHARRVVLDVRARNVAATCRMADVHPDIGRIRELVEERGEGPRDAAELEALRHADLRRRLNGHGVPADAGGLAALHGELFDGILNGAGRLRAMAAVGRPGVPAARVPAEVDEALATFRDGSGHPMVRAAHLYHDMLRIRPFHDGNGRLARHVLAQALHQEERAAASFALLDEPLLNALNAHTRALQAADAGEGKPLQRHLLALVQDSVAAAAERFRFARSLPHGLNDRQWRVADWFHTIDAERPGRRVRFREAAARFPEVAVRTLKRDLAHLRTAGVVDMEGKLKTARYSLARR